MAQTQMCSSEDGNAAVMLVSNLTNGETEAWCDECLPVFAMATLGITPEMFRAALESMPDTDDNGTTDTGLTELPGGGEDDDSKSDEDETEASPESLEESTAASE